jgi:hypothetical protein
MNRAGSEFDDKTDVLADMIATRLAEKGFSIIDRKETLAKFREYRKEDQIASSRSGKSADNKTFVDFLFRLVGDTPDKTNTQSSNQPKSLDELIDSYSAKKIANLLSAKYLVVATINSVGRETRTFKGAGTIYGTDTEVTIHTMRIAMKVLEGSLGGTLYGDFVTVEEKIPKLSNLTISSTDVANKLLDSAAVQIAENVGVKVDRIRATQVEATARVQITISSNVDGADVAIDGIVLGSTPCTLLVPQGPATLTLTREWFNPIERFVNPQPNMILNFKMELSEQGVKRWKDIENFKMQMAKAKQELDLDKKEREAEIDIKKEQSEADAYSKKRIAEGEKSKREESYERIRK